MWFFALIVVLLIGAVAVVASGRWGAMSRAYDDRPDALVPARHALSAEDIESTRFGVSVRGYRMDEVDTLLERVAREVAERDRRIADLERAVTPILHGPDGAGFTPRAEYQAEERAEYQAEGRPAGPQAPATEAAADTTEPGPAAGRIAEAEAGEDEADVPAATAAEDAGEPSAAKPSAVKPSAAEPSATAPDAVGPGESAGATAMDAPAEAPESGVPGRPGDEDAAAPSPPEEVAEGTQEAGHGLVAADPKARGRHSAAPETTPVQRPVS